MSDPMEMENETVPTQRIPSTLSPNLMDISSTDKFVILPLGFVAIVAISAYGSQLMTLIGSLVLMALLYRSDLGRNISIVAEAVFADPWIAVVQHDVLWKAGKAKRSSFRRTPALNLHVTNIGGWLGVVHIAATNTDAIIVTGSGSDIATKDIRQMHGRNLAIAEACKKVASQNGFRIGTSFLYRRRPADPYEEIDMYGNIGMAATFDAAKKMAERNEPTDSPGTPDENKAVLMRQLVEAACEEDGNITQATVWTIKREPSVQQAAKGKKPEPLQPARLIAMQVAETARDNLASVGVSDTTILDFSGVEDHLRLAWDVCDLYDYYVRRCLPAVSDDAESEPGKENDMPLDTEMEIHWPSKLIKRGRKYCQLDGTFHSVLLITRQPEEVIANSYFRLHSIPVPYLSIAAPGQAFKITREKFFYKRFIPLAEGVVEQSGIRLDPTQQGKLEKQKQRERELHGSQLSLSYNILVDVAAGSLEELEDRVAETIRQLRLHGFEPKRVTGRTLQIPAMLSATSGIPML